MASDAPRYAAMGYASQDRDDAPCVTSLDADRLGANLMTLGYPRDMSRAAEEQRAAMGANA